MEELLLVCCWKVAHDHLEGSENRIKISNYFVHRKVACEHATVNAEDLHCVEHNLPISFERPRLPKAP